MKKDKGLLAKVPDIYVSVCNISDLAQDFSNIEGETEEERQTERFGIKVRFVD